MTKPVETVEAAWRQLDPSPEKFRQAFFAPGVSVATIRLSWQQKRQLQDSVIAGIIGDETFDLDDFLYLAEHCCLDSWAGVGDRNGRWDDAGEILYAEAVKAGNESACRSIEKWKDRPAILYEGARMYVGRLFFRLGEELRCTSINTAKRFVVSVLIERSLRPSKPQQRRINWSEFELVDPQPPS
ncbi:MAG: hypothetical protein WC844_02850 [Patescibacteria group bacterium]|jgi:hypothetical protein